MRDADREKFLTLMNAMAAPFGVEVTEALLDGYWMALDDMSIEQVAKATAAALRGATRMPRPAEIRELSGDASIAVLAVHAWAKLREAAGRVGAYRSVDFGPIMNATIRAMGGWNRFCTEDNNDFVRRDFEKTFAAFAAMGVSEEQGVYLAGLTEVANRAAGFAADPPLVIEGVPQVPNKRLEAANAKKRLMEIVK